MKTLNLKEKITVSIADKGVFFGVHHLTFDTEIIHQPYLNDNF